MKTSYHVEDGKEFIGHREDITHDAQVAHEIASSKSKSERIGDWHHTWHVPNVIILEVMSKTGLDFFEPAHWKEIEKVLLRDYPAFKATPHNL